MSYKRSVIIFTLSNRRVWENRKYLSLLLGKGRGKQSFLKLSNLISCFRNVWQLQSVCPIPGWRITEWVELWWLASNIYLFSPQVYVEVLHSLQTSWMRGILARRRWHRWYHAITAMNRMRQLSFDSRWRSAGRDRWDNIITFQHHQQHLYTYQDAVQRLKLLSEHTKKEVFR